MSQFIDIVLDKPRPFRFRPVEARDACNGLSRIPGKGYVDTRRLLEMLGGLDWDAWAHVLAEGLKHDDPTMRPERAFRLLMEALEADQERMMTLTTAVIEAGQLTGVFQRPEQAKEDARGKATTAATTPIGFGDLTVLDVHGWFAWAQPVAARIGWRRHELEAIGHPEEFYEAIQGAQWRWQRAEDLAAWMTVHLMAAWGGGKKADGEYLTPADLLGREPVRLVPPPTLTEAEQEAQEWEEMQRQAKRDRALLEVYKLNALQNQRDGRGPEVVSGG